jgi:uncharacterized protein YecT (DUF1311 family)
MQTLIRTLTAIVLTLLCSHVPQAQTQAQMNRDACDEYRKADVEMNSVYGQILKSYERDTPFIEKLKKAQRAWLLFRDAHLESLYPAQDKLAAYGSVNEMCRCTVLAELTSQRTKVLKRWVTGVQEGDVCSGSIKTKQ